MKLKLLGLCAGACVISIVACSKTPSTPSAPGGVAQGSAATDAAAAADGSTLKVTAPVPTSPINGARPAQSDQIFLVVNNATAKFGANIPVFYHFQVHNAAGANMVDAINVPAGLTTTTYQVNVALEGDQTYTWRVRVEAGGGVGPWSTTQTFVAPQNEGYIRGVELYDPLINGKSVGRLVGPGPISFIPGVGLRIHSQLAYVRYQLEQTLTDGEFSMLVTGMEKNTDGDKTKLFAMAQGDSDIVTNDRRMTIEKRGDPAGVVAWRLITHGDQVDTEGPERQEVNFDASKVYYWRATWGGNVFRVTIQEGGVAGRFIYNSAKPFQGRPYDPNPHVAYLGSPVGRSGENGASVDNVTYRQVWISNRPRPSFAMQ